MQTYHKNPRQITKKEIKQLQEGLDKFGDLGGIVHDLNSDEIIGGNQRSRVFGLMQDEGQIIIEEEYETPTRTGTVAHGYIEWRGERFSYRQVKWTPEQCEEANVRANKAGGSWDWDVLANEFEMDDLMDWGFDEWEFGMQKPLDIIPEEEKELIPREMFRVLISVPISQALEARETIEVLEDLDEAEVLYGAN